MRNAQAATVARHQQQAAGVPVEAVHQFQLFRGAAGPQGLDDAKTEPAAAVDRQARRLVDDQKAVVLENDGGLDGVREALGRLTGASAPGQRFAVRANGRHFRPHGRQTNFVARG